MPLFAPVINAVFCSLITCTIRFVAGRRQPRGQLIQSRFQAADLDDEAFGPKGSIPAIEASRQEAQKHPKYSRKRYSGQPFLPALIAGILVASSIIKSRLYFARRSDCVIDPTLMKSPDHPTARSASQLSSVSPLRALTATFQPASLARR